MKTVKSGQKGVLREVVSLRSRSVTQLRDTSGSMRIVKPFDNMGYMRKF